MVLGTMESSLCAFSPGNLANTSFSGYVGYGTLSAGWVLGLVRCDAGRVMFSSEIFSAGGFSGAGRDLCCDDGRDADLLRFVEALPLSERLGHTPVEAMPFLKRFGHTMLELLEDVAAMVLKVSEVVLLGLGGRENTRLLALFELASIARGMQSSPGRGDRLPRTLCLCDMVPNGTSRPSHVLPPSAPPPGLPRRPDGLNWAPRCSPEEWTAWCRVRDGLDVSNDFSEVVQIEQEEEEVFDLVGVAESEGWDQTGLMFFVFEYWEEKGVQYCREYYEMKNNWQVRQAVGPEPTKEAKVRFLFRKFGKLGVQEVDGGVTLDEWFAGQADLSLGVGLDGYFATLGEKVLNSRVGISTLGLGSFSGGCVSWQVERWGE